MNMSYIDDKNSFWPVKNILNKFGVGTFCLGIFCVLALLKEAVEVFRLGLESIDVDDDADDDADADKDMIKKATFTYCLLFLSKPSSNFFFKILIFNK